MKQVGKERRQRKTKSEDMMEQIQKIFQERGSKALEIARKEILQEKVECKEAREALTYFMTEYWHDVARPALLSLVCEAVGGNPEITTPIAVPMILISGAIDIHDDIIDQSEVKDGRPTVLGKFGRDIALLVGDALLFKGLTLLNESGEKGISTKKLRTIVELINEMFFELGDAEALELGFRGRIDVTPQEYLDVVRTKAADVEAHTHISAILGNGSKEEVEALARYGRFLGMLIILRDDWIDILDVEETRHRTKNECLPLPVLYALQDHHATSKLHLLLRKEKISKKDVEELVRITSKIGGMKRLRQYMESLVEDALSELEIVKYKKSELELLARAMIVGLEGH